MWGTVHGERIFGLSHQPHFGQRYSLFLGQCPCLCLIKFSNEGGQRWLCNHVPPTAQAVAFAELKHNRFVSVEITEKLRDVKLHLTWWVLSPRCATLYLSVPRLFVLFALERPAMHFVDALYRWVGGRTISLDHNTRATILVAARRIFYRNNTWHEMSLYFVRMTDDEEDDWRCRSRHFGHKQFEEHLNTTTGTNTTCTRALYCIYLLRRAKGKRTTNVLLFVAQNNHSALQFIFFVFLLL